MANPRGFAKKMRAWAQDIPRQVNEIKKQTAMEIVLTVVPATPVRSGQARSNYYVTVGNPDTTSTAFGPFTRDGYQSIARAREAIQRVQPGQPIYITNNLPYIGRLNDGYSTQAPANFIQIAVAQAEAIIVRQIVRYRGY